MTEDPIDLKSVAQAVELSLRSRVRLSVQKTIAECLASQDITLLSALGVDAHGKLLQIFNEEINKFLSKEIDNA